VLFELKAATDLAELLLKQDRVPEAYNHLNAAFDRMPAGMLTRVPCKSSASCNPALRPSA
jgi:hypothetical protein